MLRLKYHYYTYSSKTPLHVHTTNKALFEQKNYCCYFLPGKLFLNYLSNGSTCKDTLNCMNNSTHHRKIENALSIVLLLSFLLENPNFHN